MCSIQRLLYKNIVLINGLFLFSCTFNGQIQTLSSNKLSASHNTAILNFDDGAYSYGFSKSSVLTWTPQLSAQDLTDGVTYQACVGSAVGACDVTDWTFVGTSGSATLPVSGMNKSLSSTYYTSLRTINKDNSTGPVSTGDGWHPSWISVQASDIPSTPPNAIERDSSGRIYLGGSFSGRLNSSQVIYGSYKLNADGTSNPSYFQNTQQVVGDPKGIALQSDGKIVLVGYSVYANKNVNGILRLNTDGTVDKSFGVGSGFSPSYNAQTVALQTDGKVIVGGNFTTFNGSQANRILRLNSDGSVDPTFSSGAGFDNTVNSLAIQTDGKILAVGNFLNYQGIARSYVARLNSDGSLDSSFNTSNYLGSSADNVQIQSDGKILVSGSFTTWNSANQKGIIRLNSDGSKDTGFNIGTGFNVAPYSVKLLSSGKIICYGSFISYNGTTRNHFALLNSDGSLDTSFNPGTGIGATGGSSHPFMLQEQSSGKIIFNYPGSGIASLTYNGTSANRVFRLNLDGSLDLSFSSSVNFYGTPYRMVVLSDDSLVALGALQFDLSVSTPQVALMRLNADMSFDSSFNMGTGFPAGSNISKIAVQPDDKIIVSGNFNSYNGNTANTMVRINSDGSHDASFNVGTGFANGGSGFGFYKVILLPSGQLYVQGSYSTFKGISEKGLIRLNADGSKDTSFNIGTGPAGVPGAYITQIALQSDGKLLVAGKFTTFNGSAKSYLARLNTDGSVDNTFTPQTFLYTGLPSMTYTTCVDISPDAKIYVGGWFDQYGSTSAVYSARLDNSGLLDTSFSHVVNPCDPFSPKVFQNDLKFYSYAGIFQRYHSNGSEDDTFPWFLSAGTFLKVSDSEIYISGGQKYDQTRSETIYGSGHDQVLNFGLIKENE